MFFTLMESDHLDKPIMSTNDMATGVGPAKQEAHEKQVQRAGLLIGSSYLVMGLVDPNSGILQLPLQWLLKERLHFEASEMAAFFAAALIPWNFKAIAGFLSDSVPLFGNRRRSYLIGGSCLASMCALLIAFLPHTRSSILASIFLIHTGLMFVSTTTGAVLVEAGDRLGASGRLSSWRSFAEGFAGMLAGPVGGFLAGKALGAPTFICAALAAFLAGVFVLSVKEPAMAVASRSMREHFRFITDLLKNRNLWITAGMLSCFNIAPGFQTPLYFYQTNTLHFDSSFLGGLSLLGALGSMLGSLVYAVTSKRVDFSKLFPWSMMVCALMTLCYIGYASVSSAVMIGFGSGFCSTFAFISLLQLIAQTIPKNHEALGYALVFSIGNFVAGFSDILGSYLFDVGMKFADLVWLNAGTTALIALAWPFLPKFFRRQNSTAKF